MKKLLVIIALFAISCNPFENISEVKKREELLRNPRFKELPEEEMYTFLNEVYLPRLDSLKMTKNIVANPSKYEPRIFEDLKVEKKENWYSQRKIKIDLSKIPPPIFEEIDSTYSWNQSRLVNVNLINDVHDYFNKNIRNDAIYISKPFRDTKKGTIILQEFYTAFWCCTCSPEQLFFLKTDSGWKQIPRY